MLTYPVFIKKIKLLYWIFQTDTYCSQPSQNLLHKSQTVASTKLWACESQSIQLGPVKSLFFFFFMNQIPFPVRMARSHTRPKQQNSSAHRYFGVHPPDGPDRSETPDGETTNAALLVTEWRHVTGNNKDQITVEKKSDPLLVHLRTFLKAFRGIRVSSRFLFETLTVAVVEDFCHGARRSGLRRRCRRPRRVPP